MNIISNNCLGGYIYQNILHARYENPFIWTLIKNPDDYITMIEHFNDLDFNNIRIGKDGSGMSNNFYLLIDGKIKLEFIHVYFDAKRNTIEKFENTPRIEGENLYSQRPWEYITEKYKERLLRMNEATKHLFIFFDPNTKSKRLNELPEICLKNKFKCIIFSNEKLNENEYVKIIKPGKINLPSKICSVFGKDIQKYINDNFEE